MRKNYQEHYKKLKLTKNQVEDLSNFIDNMKFSYDRFDKESTAWDDAFNHIFWYFIGEADCNDMFSDEYAEKVSLLEIKNVEIDEIKIKTKTVEIFVDFLKTILTEIQYNQFVKSMKELYVDEKEYIEQEYYLEEKYMKHKTYAKHCFLTELMK